MLDRLSSIGNKISWTPLPNKPPARCPSGRLVARSSAHKPCAAQLMFPASLEAASRIATAPHHKSIAVDHCVRTFFYYTLQALHMFWSKLVDVSHPEGTQDIWA